MLFQLLGSGHVDLYRQVFLKPIYNPFFPKIRHEKKIILSQHLSLYISPSPFCLPPTPLIFKLNLASVL